MSSLYMRCERCDLRVKPEVYESNDGLCVKCSTHKYPADCFDPRKDMRSWWTDPQTVCKTPAKIRPVKYGFARGRLAAE